MRIKADCDLLKGLYKYENQVWDYDLLKGLGRSNEPYVTKSYKVIGFCWRAISGFILIY